MPPTDARDALARWTFSSRSTAVAVVKGGDLEANTRFRALDRGEAWRWLNGPHARVRYASLTELVRTEAATLAPAPYMARFERAAQVIEVRLERLDGGEAIALVHDVTGEVRRQQELQRDREALLHEERMHAMGVLASGVAHDLNHSLNIIALRVATLRADPALSAARRTLDVLGRVVGDAARVVARLQDLARKRRDRPSDPLDLAAVLTGAVEMARTESDVVGVRIEADVPPLPLVRGSAAELAHVFGSLLVHAREQMPEGGIVRVRARQDRGRVMVTIRDYGEGMYEEDVARLFNPFSGVAGETALGLSVAWGVMSRLGGSLQAQSRHGEGTTFVLTFPCAAPARPGAAAARAAAGHPPHPHRRRRGRQRGRAPGIARAGAPPHPHRAQRAGGAFALRARRAFRPGALRRGHAGDERLAGGAGNPAAGPGHAGVDADRLGERDRRDGSAARAGARRAREAARPGCSSARCSSHSREPDRRRERRRRPTLRPSSTDRSSSQPRRALRHVADQAGHDAEALRGESKGVVHVGEAAAHVPALLDVPDTCVPQRRRKTSRPAPSGVKLVVTSTVQPLFGSGKA